MEKIEIITEQDYLNAGGKVSVSFEGNDGLIYMQGYNESLGLYHYRSSMDSIKKLSELVNDDSEVDLIPYIELINKSI